MLHKGVLFLHIVYLFRKTFWVGSLVVKNQTDHKPSLTSWKWKPVEGKPVFSCCFIGVRLCGKFYGCRTALNTTPPTLTTAYCSTGSIAEIHLPLKSMSNLILNSMFLLRISKESILIDSELSRHLAYVNTFLFLLSDLPVSTHSISLPVFLVCTKLAKPFAVMTVGFPRSWSLKFGKVWKYIASSSGAKRERSLAGERPSISPAHPQDHGCMFPPPCLGDAGTSPHLNKLRSDQGTDLAGGKSFLWAGLVWAGSEAGSVSAAQPHELQHPQRGGSRSTQLWVGGNTPFDSCLLLWWPDLSLTESHLGSWPLRELCFEEVECIDSGMHLKSGQEE